MTANRYANLRILSALALARGLVTASAGLFSPAPGPPSGAHRSGIAARQDVFDYIGMFYKPKRKHTNNGMLSPPLGDCMQSPAGNG